MNETVFIPLVSTQVEFIYLSDVCASDTDLCILDTSCLGTSGGSPDSLWQAELCMFCSELSEGVK